METVRRNMLDRKKKRCYFLVENFFPCVRDSRNDGGARVKIQPVCRAVVFSPARAVLCFLLLLCFLPLPRAGAAETYVFGVYPVTDPVKMFAAFRPLGDFISARTGHPVRVVVTRNYEEMTTRLAEGSIHFAFYTSAGYVAFASAIPGLVYVATYAELDSEGAVTPYYRSTIVSLEEGPVDALADLKGRNFGFTDKRSTSGYTIPRLMLRSLGMEPDSFFGKVFFLGRHDSVVEALRAGSIHGGAVSDGTLYSAVGRYGDIFRVLAVSDPIPLDAVVAAPGVKAEHVEAVRAGLVSLAPDSAPVSAFRELGWPAAGFVVLGDEFYEPLRKALEDAEKEGESGE